MEREVQSSCDVCAVTSVGTASRNFSAKRLTSTLTCAPTRATARGRRAAQMWNPWGLPNLRRENQILCDVCVVTYVSNVSYNFGTKR